MACLEATEGAPASQQETSENLAERRRTKDHQPDPGEVGRDLPGVTKTEIHRAAEKGRGGASRGRVSCGGNRGLGDKTQGPILTFFLQNKRENMSGQRECRGERQQGVGTAVAHCRIAPLNKPRKESQDPLLK